MTISDGPLRKQVQNHNEALGRLDQRSQLMRDILVNIDGALGDMADDVQALKKDAERLQQTAGRIEGHIKVMRTQIARLPSD